MREGREAAARAWRALVGIAGAKRTKTALPRVPDGHIEEHYKCSVEAARRNHREILEAEDACQWQGLALRRREL
jgi:hypothetical protein